MGSVVQGGGELGCSPHGPSCRQQPPVQTEPPEVDDGSATHSHDGEGGRGGGEERWVFKGSDGWWVKTVFWVEGEARVQEGCFDFPPTGQEAQRKLMTAPRTDCKERRQSPDSLADPASNLPTRAESSSHRANHCKRARTEGGTIVTPPPQFLRVSRPGDSSSQELAAA